MPQQIRIIHTSPGASPEWKSLSSNGTPDQYAETTYGVPCDCIQEAKNEQSESRCSDAFSHISSSRGETAANHIERVLGLVNRIEASGEYLAVGPKVPAGCSTQLQIRCRESRSIRGGSSLASSHVVTLRCDFHPSAADLGGASNPDALPSFTGARQ